MLTRLYWGEGQVWIRPILVHAWKGILSLDRRELEGEPLLSWCEGRELLSGGTRSTGWGREGKGNTEKEK